MNAKAVGQGLATIALAGAVAKLQKSKKAKSSKGRDRKKSGKDSKPAKPAKPGWVAKLVSGIRDESISQGVFGESRPWLAVAAVYWGFRGFRWAMKRPPSELVFREVLAPGERVVITQLSKKSAKSAR